MGMKLTSKRVRICSKGRDSSLRHGRGFNTAMEQFQSRSASYFIPHGSKLQLLLRPRSVSFELLTQLSDSLHQLKETISLSDVICESQK